jgi:hypothetical protein
VNPARKASIVTGVLLVLATVAALAAAQVVPALSGTDDLTGVAHHPHRLAAGALLHLVAAGTSVGIAVALYPVLSRTDGTLALGSVIFRTIEAVFYTAAVVSLLAVVPLAQRFAAAPAGGRAPFRAIVDTLLAVREQSTLAGVLAFSVGASMYYLVFYRHLLVPRWLSGWGLAGALLMTTACLLALFGGSPVTGYPLLILPVAIQEMVLAGWLLAKGFEGPGHGAAAGPSVDRARWLLHRRATARSLLR